MTLLSEIRALNALFKSNLGAFMSKLQANAAKEPAEQEANIESLLTHLDLIISNQKELGDLIQRVKNHQKLSRELDLANESIQGTKTAIIEIISRLQQKDVQLGRLLHESDSLRVRMESIIPIIQNPQAAVLAAERLALTCSAPIGWQPGAPLLPHRPPYPTEDLIRRSSLFALMSGKHEQNPPATETVDASAQSASQDTSLATTDTLAATAATGVVASRRRKGPQDKAKLLDLDLNPDL